jgi:uroporphyrinogen-III synthase
VDRRRLLDLLPDGDNDNALETAIARLRARLPARDLVQTVIKRGYRLAAAP